ncbi:MAG: ABC transporter ATP-binding protein/permease [Candidatus Dormibacteraeota bacterium]|nr:ABC transporter ATP-binding protein/permease [Candidatus Dormibacteraeota bacterium]
MSVRGARWAGGNDEVLGKAYDGRLMRRLWSFVRPHRTLGVIGLVLLLLSSLSDLAGPYFTQQAIDQYIRPGRLTGYGKLAALWMLVIVLNFGARYWQSFAMNLLGQRVMFDVRNAIFSHLQRMSLTYFDHTPVGVLVTRMTNDVDALNQLLTSGLVAVIGDLFSLVVIAGFLLWVNWQMALVVFLIMPVVVAVTAVMRTQMRETYRAIRTRIGRINGFLQEAVSGVLTIQLFNHEERTMRDFDALNEDYLRANLRSVALFSIFMPLMSFIGSLTFALILWVGGGRVIQGALTLGTLVLFLQLSDRLYQPIRDLSEKYNILQAAMAACERIFGILDEPARDLDQPGAIRLPALQGAIALDHVWFAYQNEDWVLRDVSITIDPGEKVAVVGATGAGKTSLISLLTRFYDVQQGAVTVDGHDVRTLSRHDLRRHIGVILQDPFIFTGTVAENIALGEPMARSRIEAAARAVNADRFIRRLSQGYDQPLHERGSDLSTGQKQLIAFARALAFDPAVLMVLDEATANVDTSTEAIIQDSLKTLMQGRTSIIIAHRLSTIRHVDRIVVLHRGRVVETGSHAELLARRGVYFRLYELQYKDQAPALSA